MFVKICGITNEEDGLLAVAMGADAVGFVFAPSSRRLAPQQARDIVRRLPGHVMTVGVFRDEAPQRVIDIVNQVGLGAAQLHGHETPEDTQAVRRGVPFVIQAFAAGSVAIERWARHQADLVLVDSHEPGSGEVFDWSWAEGAPLGRRFLLAGGLTPDNVGEAIERLRPWGVDVSSGVEASPGRKDPRLMRAFIAAAKAAEPPAHVGASTEPYDWQAE